MIAVLQRVSSARVTVADQVVGHIDRGILALVSVHADDSPADILWTAHKLATIRLFPNADKLLDLDLTQIAGSLLLVSNFTVAADTSTGRRPSLNPAAPPAPARELFDQLVTAARALHLPVQTGQFGADMLVHLVNDGPVTLLLDSRPARKNKPPATD